jgi:predicted component of viral defense system (DUF524 family)
VWRGDEVVKALIFDAKYKIYYHGGRESFWEEDLEKMDYYRNNILWKPLNPRSQPRSVVAAAYILYPGEVLEHDAHAPEVGALPLKPKEENRKATLTVIKDLMQHAGII